jgi:GNAT superfamily N-acetyltransferase
LDPLLLNHLLFMRRHRGDYHIGSKGVYIVSEAPGFTSWIPLHAEAAIPPDIEAIRLVPQSGAGWPARLQLAGFEAAESLSYQNLDLTNPITARRAEPDVKIHRATCRDGALAFAEVQSAAFLHGEGPDEMWWRQFFRHVALRNIGDADQDFLMIDLDGTTVAVLLLIHQESLGGIYAVATRPEYRNRGLSTALLSAASERARSRGSDRLILQAMVGSFADGFYRRLGFEERFRSEVWRKIEA